MLKSYLRSLSLRSPKTARVLLIAVAVLLPLCVALVWGAGGWSKPDYQGYDLNRPWFDGEAYPFYLDMYNQRSLKPQEEGTFQRFPENSIPREGSEPFIASTAVEGDQLVRQLLPQNPTAATPESIARGAVVYQSFCAPCHGTEGMSRTELVTLHGIPAVPLRPLVPTQTESKIYNTVLYGGVLMPSYGFQTTARERWDLVNYLKSAAFQGETR